MKMYSEEWFEKVNNKLKEYEKQRLHRKRQVNFENLNSVLSTLLYNNTGTFYYTNRINKIRKEIEILKNLGCTF